MRQQEIDWNAAEKGSLVRLAQLPDVLVPCGRRQVKVTRGKLKSVLAAIGRYCQMRDGCCWASQAELAIETNLSRRTVQLAIAGLLQLGVVAEDRRGPKPNAYVLVRSQLALLDPQRGGSTRGGNDAQRVAHHLAGNDAQQLRNDAQRVAPKCLELQETTTTTAKSFEFETVTAAGDWPAIERDLADCGVQGPGLVLARLRERGGTAEEAAEAIEQFRANVAAGTEIRKGGLVYRLEKGAWPREMLSLVECQAASAARAENDAKRAARESENDRWAAHQALKRALASGRDRAATIERLVAAGARREWF